MVTTMTSQLHDDRLAKISKGCLHDQMTTLLLSQIRCVSENPFESSGLGQKKKKKTCADIKTNYLYSRTQNASGAPRRQATNDFFTV